MSDDEEFYDYEDEEEEEEEERILQLFELIDKSPEEAMKVARRSIVSGWYHEWFEAEPDVTAWTSAKILINALKEAAKRGLDSEDLLDRLKWNLGVYYLVYYYFGEAHLDRLWRKLAKEQKEAFLKDLYHDLAESGLREFLRTVGRRKLSLEEINDYLNGKISFRDLMKKLARKYNVYESDPETAEDFWNAVDLASYLSDEELKKIIKDCVLSAKLAELKEQKQKRKRKP